MRSRSHALRRAFKPDLESLEQKSLLVAALIDLQMLSASLSYTTDNIPKVSYVYNTDGLFASEPAAILFYRSQYKDLLTHYNDAMLLEQTQVPASAASASAAFTLHNPLSSDPSRPYLLVSIGFTAPVGTRVDPSPDNNTVALTIGSPDIAPTAPSLDLGEGSVNVGYKVAGAALTAAAILDLYWAGSDGKTIGTPLHEYSIPAGAPVTDLQPLPTYTLTNTQLDNIPYNATQLVAVVSGGGDSDPNNNLQSVPIPLAWGAKLPSSLTNPDGTTITRQQFIDRVDQMAVNLQTNPNYLMTIMAAETDGRLDPYEDIPAAQNDGIRNVGLIHFTGESAADTLNSMKLQMVIELLYASNISRQDVAALQLPKHGQLFVSDQDGHYSSADGNKAQDIIKKINVLGQLSLIERYLQDRLKTSVIQTKIAAARGTDAPKVTINNQVYYAPTNLGDLYGLVLSSNLITLDESTPFHQFPGQTTVGGVRTALRQTLIKGWTLFSL